MIRSLATVVLSVLYMARIGLTLHNHLCNFTTWELVEQEQFDTKAITGVLHKSDGSRQEVKTEVVIKGGKDWYNLSYVMEDCCVGYERRGRRDGCKQCSYATYGRKCLQSCQCNDCRKCDHVTGECSECEDLISALTTATTMVTTSTTATTMVTTSTTATTMVTTSTTATTMVTTSYNTDGYENCDICRTYNNCTSLRCGRANVGERSKDTVWTFAVASLGVIIIVLVIAIFWKKIKKRRRSRTAIPSYCEIPGRSFYDGFFNVNNQQVKTNWNGKISVTEIGGNQRGNQEGAQPTEITDDHYDYIV